MVSVLVVDDHPIVLDGVRLLVDSTSWITLATAAGFALILAGSVLATQREPVREPAPRVPVGAHGIDDVAGEDVGACPVAEP